MYNVRIHQPFILCFDGTSVIHFASYIIIKITVIECKIYDKQFKYRITFKGLDSLVAYTHVIVMTVAYSCII